MKTFSGNITPASDTIFVFGSNPEGRHGAGSAAVAVKYFGAEYGNGEGLQGQAYALPTTDLRPDHEHSIPANEIIQNIIRMYKTAESMPNKKFKVAYRNQPNEVTLCGYSGAQLMAMFVRAAELNGGMPENVYISEEWNNSGFFSEY